MRKKLCGIFFILFVFNLHADIKEDLEQINKRHYNLVSQTPVFFQCSMTNDIFNDIKETAKLNKTLDMESLKNIDEMHIDMQFYNGKIRMAPSSVEITGNKLLDSLMVEGAHSQAKGLYSLYQMVNSYWYSPLFYTPPQHSDNNYFWEGDILKYEYIYKDTPSLNEYYFKKNGILEKVVISKKGEDASVIINTTYTLLNGIYVIHSFTVYRAEQNVLMEFELEYGIHEGLLLPKKIKSKITNSENEVMETTYFFSNFTVEKNDKNKF